MKKLMLIALTAIALLAQQTGAIRASTARIASGATTSGAVFVGEFVPIALQMPSAFTGTTVTFNGSGDGETYQQIYTGGAVYTETVAASKNISLDASAFAAYEWVQVVSGSAEGAARSIVVLSRKGNR